MIDTHHGWNRSFKPLFLGYTLSLIFIFAAYRIIVHHHLSDGALLFTIMGLGVLQAAIQLAFFLHLGLESKPRWNFMMFLFMVLVIIVIVGGSLWIMYQLNYNVMMPMGH